MHRLVIVRHAKSDWSLDVPDHDRPLNPRGNRDAQAVGAWLATNVDPVDLALVSSAVRTQETWRIISAFWSAGSSVTEPSLYEASTRKIVSQIESLDEHVESAVLVGHNPGVSDALNDLVGAREFEFKTSSVAIVQIASEWAAARGNASTSEFVTPRG